MRQLFDDRAGGADPIPVILDSGTAARVAAINPPRAPFVGMRFFHGGTVWQIVRAKDHVRGWVARPARFRFG
jgi:hypothetical protein